MNIRKLERQWAQFVEGDLSPEEAKDLIVILRDNPDISSRFLADMDFAATLQMMLGKSDEALAAEVMKIVSHTLAEDQTRSQRPVAGGKRIMWRGWVAIAAAASLLAAFGLWWWQAGQGEVDVVARVAVVGGQTTMERAGARRPLAAGMDVCKGDRIRTGPEGRATVVFVESGASIELSLLSDLTVVSEGALHLANGGIVAAVEKRNGGNSFKVTTPQATVEVVGTVFGIETGARRRGNGADVNATLVETYEGEVKVARRADDSRVTVSAGQRVSVSALDAKQLSIAAISGWAGIRRGPKGEILRQYKWTFKKNNVSKGFTLPGGMSCVALPLRLRGRPCRIEIRGIAVDYDMSPLATLPWSLDINEWKCWCRDSRKLTRRVDLEQWVYGSRWLKSIRRNDSWVLWEILENESPAVNRIGILDIKRRIRSIRATETTVSELPEALAREEAWKSLKKNMPFVRSVRGGRLSDYEPNPLYKKESAMRRDTP